MNRVDGEQVCTGFVARVSERGFAFIKRQGARDLFLHCRHFAGDFDQLKERDEVEFVVGIDQHGRPEAQSARKI